MANNILHDLGITKIHFCTIIENKKPLITCTMMPRIPYASIDQKLWNKKCPRCICFNMWHFFWSLNNTFSRRHKFTVLLNIFRPYCVKVNATCGCPQKLHPFNCNKNRIMMTKWKGWHNTKLLHLFNYNKTITTTKWKGLENT